MRYAVLVVLLLSAPAGAAELATVGDGAVTETSFAYEVRIEGVVAHVTARQTLRGSAADAEAVYSFALPADAAIVGLTVTPSGGEAAVAAAVDAAAAISAAPDRDTVAITPDMGLVRRLGALEVGGDIAYEARIYPIAKTGTTTVEITWVEALDYVDGRLGLRIPARGDSDAFATATGTVTATPPPGVKELRDLNARGALLAAKPGKKTWTFAVDEDEVRLDVRPVLTRAVAAFSTVALDDESGAIALTVLRPRAADAPSRFEEVIFVVDGSTSAAGDAATREAMATLVDAIGDGVRDDARLQAVIFDRTTTAVLDEPGAATATTRAAIGKAIRAIEPRAGTDVTGALVEVERRISGGETLVVILTDGMVPSDTTAETLLAALAEAPGQVTVSAVLLAAEAMPLADPREGAIAELARRTGGHTVAVRAGEADARSATLADEVGAAPDWEIAHLTAGDADLAVPLPDAIPAGGGVISFGWYRGDEPAAVAFSATGAKKLKVAKKSIPSVAALALAGGTEPLLPADAAGHGPIDRALAKRSRAIGAVDARTALVAVDPADELARERLALAARGGTFSRIPPPPEAALETVPEAHVDDVVDVGARFIMDTAARIRVDLLSPQLVPAAKRCFREAMQDGGTRRGQVSIEIEIARGEVLAVRATSTTASTTLLDCLRDAAYTLTVPTYTLTEGVDTIHLIRYPILFTRSAVSVDDGEGQVPIDTGINTEDPLGDLTAE